MKRTCLGIIIAVSVTLAASAFAQSRRTTPLSGRAWNSADASCFSSSWNKLTNNGSCGTSQRKWLFDAPIESTGNYHAFLFFGRGGSNGAGTTCTAVGNSKDGASGWMVSQGTVSAWGAMGTQSYVWVPTDGTLHADCDLPIGGGVSAFAYAP